MVNKLRNRQDVWYIGVFVLIGMPLMLSNIKSVLEICGEVFTNICSAFSI